MVNPDVDCYTKTLNFRKKTPKNAKNNNLLKTKRILKQEYYLSGGPVFTFSLPGGRFTHLLPNSYATVAQQSKQTLRG